MKHMSDDAKSLLDAATRQGNTKLRDQLLSGEAMMPSPEDIDSKLLANLVEQHGDVVEVNDPDNGTAR